jgi:Fur family ferric uptake transcriptional regulator
VTERNTRQREAIRSALAEAGRPLSPLEVHAAAQASVSRLGMATVYRALARLVAEGELVQVDLPGAPPRYEVAGLSHHHHFHCRRCGRVFDLPGCPGNFDKLTPRGFKLEAHEVVLYGRCAACSGA